jgi:antitoxin CptB
MTELGKIRWHCRRGLLELDLILERFNEKHLTSLESGELERFKELLAFADNDLLDLVMARCPVPDRRYEHVVQLLRGA